MESGMFIAALTNVRHLSVSWASSTQSITPHPTSWRSILILSSHLSLGLPSGLFPQGFPTKTLYTPLLSPMRATCPAHTILDFIARTILGEEYRSLSSSVYGFLHSPVTWSLRPKYSPQRPVLKHHQPTFFPQCEWPSPCSRLFVWRFRNTIRFYGQELLASRQTPCRLSATAFSIYSPLPSILEAVPASATWARAIPWWQGPTYHGR